MRLTWQQIPSTVVSEILCINSEGVVLDTEHGCFNNETLFSCIQVIRQNQKKCLVRLTEVNKEKIRYCLDAGADGLIFSTIETDDQCRKIIEFSCFSPKGKRGLGLVRQNQWGATGKLLCDDPILIPQIETKKSIDNLENIKSYNFDYFLIGPYDLSLSLGLPGDFSNKNFHSKICQYNDIIPKEKRAVHIPNNIEDSLDKYKDYGLVCLGMDTIAILEFHRSIMKSVKH